MFSRIGSGDIMKRAIITCFVGLSIILAGAVKTAAHHTAATQSVHRK
jgi:hypothetical protein